jgi:hypothetical protein
MVDAAGVPPIVRLIASPAGALFVRLTGNRAATRAMLRGNGHRPSLDNGRIPRAWIDWRTSVSRDTESMRHERAMVRAIVLGRRYRSGLTMTEPELRSIHHPTLMLVRDERSSWQSFGLDANDGGHGERATQPRRGRWPHGLAR